jgi:hypothetical protein
MTEKSVNLLEIITGALIIATSLLGCWASIYLGKTPFLLAFWQPEIYNEVELWQSILLAVSSIILLVGGALYIFHGIKPLKTLRFIGFILLCVGFAGLLTSTFSIMADYDFPIFQFIENGYLGLGLGFFLGIAAIVFGVIGFVKDSKTDA